MLTFFLIQEVKKISFKNAANIAMVTINKLRKVK